MTDLSLRIRELAAQVGSPIATPNPRPQPSACPPNPPAAPADGAKAATAEPAPPSPGPGPDTALVAHLLGLPLDAFAEAGHGLEVRVPWAPEPLWFVPTEADTHDLAREDIHRGRIWTAAELRDLLAIPGITKAQPRTIALTKLAFAGDLVAVEPTPAERPDAGRAAPAVPIDPSGWPAALPGLGPKRGPVQAVRGLWCWHLGRLRRGRVLPGVRQ